MNINTDPTQLPFPLRLLMLAGVAGAGGNALDHVLEKLPASVLAAFLAVIGGLVLELLRPIARAHGERAARKMSRESTPPADPESKQ